MLFLWVKAFEYHIHVIHATNISLIVSLIAKLNDLIITYCVFVIAVISDIACISSTNGSCEVFSSFIHTNGAQKWKGKYTKIYNQEV